LISKILRHKRLLPFILMLVVAMALPLGMPSFFISFLISFFIFASLSQSLNIMMNFMGYYEFGRAFFSGLGAYVGAIVQRDLGISPFLSIPISILICFIIAFGVIIGAQRMRGISFCLVAMALVYLTQNLFSALSWTGGPEGIVLKPLETDPFTAEIIFYEVSLIYLLMVTLVVYLISRSKLGLAMRAIRGDEDVAEVRGVNTVYTKAVGYAISAALSGGVGNIWGYYAGYIDPASAFSFVFSMYIVLMILLGGMESLFGPLVGSFIFVFLLEFLRYSIGVAFEGLHAIIFGILLLIIVLFIPKGVLEIIKKLNARALARLRAT